MHRVLQMNTLSNPTISGDIAEQVTIQLYSASQWRLSPTQ